MAIVIFPKCQLSKPLPGAHINWGHPLANGLVGCWVLSEGSSGPRSLIDNTLGTLNGGIAWVPIQGLGLQANGTTGYADLGSSAPAAPASGTYSVLVRVMLQRVSPSYPMIVARAAGTGNDWEIGISSSTNFPYVGFNGGPNYTMATLTVTDNVAPCDIVFTCDGALFRGYLNGVLDVGGTSNQLVWRTANGNVNFCRRPGDNYFGGNGQVVYHVYFFNRCLQQAEIITLYTNPYVFLQPQSPQERYWAVSPAAAAGPTLTLQWQGVDIR